MAFLDKAGLEHLWAQIMNQLNTKENLDSKTTIISETSTNAQYPGAKAVYDFVAANIPDTSTVTIAASAWSNNSAVVSVNGVTPSNNIFVTPSASSYIAYADAQIRCTAQDTGTLTFACETTPTTDISVNVLILNS